MLRLLPLLTLLLVAACRNTPPRILEPEGDVAASEPASLEDVRFVYRVGPGDVLRVNVFGHPDLSSPLMEGGPGSPVDGTGAVMLPAIGSLDVDGCTVQEVAARVETALRRYLNEPRVDVAVVEYGSQRVFVLGEVEQPGAVVLERPTSAYEVLARAGGFGPYANMRQVAWVSGAMTEENLRLFDGTEIDPVGVERVRPGDLIYVGRRSWASTSQAAQELLPIFAVLAQPVSLAIQALTLERISD